MRRLRNINQEVINTSQPPRSKRQSHKDEETRGLCFLTMKNFCSECEHMKFEDSTGLGWCEVFDFDVDSEEEACVEFEEKDKEE